jgi:hypothetical protein
MKELFQMGDIVAPKDFFEAEREVRMSICNGVGPKAWWRFLVPQKLLGFDYSPAADVHDWMYHYGKTLEDKDKADRVFFNNMSRGIELNSSSAARIVPKMLLALLYTWLVSRLGYAAFWAGKNKELNTEEELCHYSENS